MTELRTEHLLGYDVCSAGPATVVSSIMAWVARGEGPRWLACMNPHSYVVALDSPAFAAALRDADWLVPDGAGVVLASRMRAGSIRTRITGSDVFEGVSRSMNAAGGGRVFFLGSTEETLRRIREKVAVDYPRLEIVGTYSPPFKPVYSELEMDEMLSVVKRSGADVLWVGMTAPKQELWIHRARGRLDVKFCGAIGAVFDYYVGRIKRPSRVFQRSGLEWLPRLLQEPRRLWRRTLVSAPIFLAHALRESVAPRRR